MFSIFKYSIITFGCQMNKADSERIAGLLTNMGGAPAAPEEADVILINTCSVREHAEQRVYGKLGELKRLKQARPGMKIGVCGCMAQREGEELLRRAPFVDLVVGPESLHRIPELLADAEVESVQLSLEGLPDELPVRRESAWHAWINVIRGCNNFCSYCIVPYVRGREHSRPLSVILEEVRRLADDGCREITLLGQNVNSYGQDLPERPDFAFLLERLNEIVGLERIRFATSHPKDMSGRLIAALRDIPKVCEQLHLPVQSGDNEVLRSMGRGYTACEYRALVERIREALPDITLSTDVIAGFPGESDEAFEATMRLFEEIRFDQAFMFYYSPRAGTRAASFEGLLPVETRKARLAKLIALQNRITCEKNSEAVGSSEEILVEGPDRKKGSRMTGKTRGGKMVVADGLEMSAMGSLAMVELTDAYLWGFTGSAVKEREVCSI